MTELTAIVVNWRTPELALRAAAGLLGDGVPPERLVVVDNGSGDASASRLEDALPGSRVLVLPANVGFARANNLAACTLPARHAYLLVNSDAFVHAPGSTGRLVAALRTDPSVGAAVPRLLNRDLSLQRSVYPLSSPLPELVRAGGLSHLLPDRLAPTLGAHWSHGSSRPIQAAVGAVLAVRALTWEQLGGFDETHFMFGEDLDLFWRLRRLGWGARFVADAEFVHLGGASAASAWTAPERAERVARAEAAMLRGRLGRTRAGLTIATMAGGAAVRALVHRSAGRRDAAAVQRAWLRGYRSGP